MTGGFYNTLLIFEINIHQSKSWPISLGPFEVVKKRPYKVSIDIDPLLLRSINLM